MRAKREEMQQEETKRVPAEWAAELCAARGGNFREEVEAHFWHGVVVATPEVFLLGRAVPYGAEVDSVWDHWPAAAGEAWYVWTGVGAAEVLLGLMPYELPWIGWVRQGRGWRRVHWVHTAELRARLGRGARRAEDRRR